jgi:hypothetical protein
MQPEERVRQEPRSDVMGPDFLERIIFVGSAPRSGLPASC